MELKPAIYLRFCGNCGARTSVLPDRCSECGQRVAPCPLIFRTAMCGYVGSDERECPKTFRACRDWFKNEKRFAGWMETMPR